MHKIATIIADLGTQETALHQAPYGNTNPDNEECQNKPPKIINANTTLMLC